MPPFLIESTYVHAPQSKCSPGTHSCILGRLVRVVALTADDDLRYKLHRLVYLGSR